MYEFCQRALADAADFFSRGATNELELLKQIQQERERNLEGQVSELKGDFSREKEALEKRVRDGDIERSELSAME
jgi:chromosome segregation ATPase